MALITGNTYPVKEQLRAFGGRWDATAKAWIVPDHKADEARRLVGTARGTGRRPRTCKTCGCKINYGTYCGKCEYA